MSFVTAYTDSGDEVRVPERWLSHPVLGRNLRKTKPTSKPPKTPEPVKGDSEKEK